MFCLIFAAYAPWETSIMREVVNSVLWIGNALDARDLKAVLAHRIEAVIDLAIEEPPCPLSRELVYCRFPLVDGQGNSPTLIETAINCGVAFFTAGMPTLISCGGGMSRSPAIAAAVVARIDQIPPEEAIKRVAASGPHDVAPLLWKDVVDVLKKISDSELSTTG